MGTFLAAGLAVAVGFSATVSAVAAQQAKAATTKAEHTAFTTLLQRYVKSSTDGVNRVDYVAFKAEGHAQLKTYIADLERAQPAKYEPNRRKAFWINLYNAKTLDIVLARYPVGSIRDITIPGPDGREGDGPWKANVVTVEDKAMSLDDIEKSKLAELNDVRIHYALNCLSIGCPNLLPTAFEAARIERQLDGAARAFVNHPRGITIKPGKVEASSIYEWYEAEFGGFKGVIAHLSKYARPELRKMLAGVSKIDAYDYDWKLSDAAGKR